MNKNTWKKIYRACRLFINAGEVSPEIKPEYLSDGKYYRFATYNVDGYLIHSNYYCDDAEIKLTRYWGDQDNTQLVRA